MSSEEESVNNDKVNSNVEDDSNEIIKSGFDEQEPEENENTEEVQREEPTGGENNDGDRKVVNPKRVIRNPQPKLNEETLKGPRGIAALESYFHKVKLKGKGYEYQDINVIMKTYEYWCHRLFPKFPFDTCIERLEKLGTKKAVQTHIKRIRFDLLVDEDKPIIDSSDEEANVDGFLDVQNNEIDLQNREFDQLATSLPPVNQNAAVLTEEQLEQIKLNKERAEKLRQERLKQIPEKAQVNLEVPSQLPSTSGLDSEVREEEFYSQETQSDIFQSRQEIHTEESTFDHESNIKGKSTIRGNSIKKKSSKAAISNDNNENEIFKSNILESSSETNDDNSVDNSILKRKSKFRPFIESDESDQEMENSLEVSDNIAAEKEVKTSRNKITNALNSEQSDEEVDQNGTDLNTNSVNGISNNTENHVSQNSSKSKLTTNCMEEMEVVETGADLYANNSSCKTDNHQNSGNTENSSLINNIS